MSVPGRLWIVLCFLVPPLAFPADPVPQLLSAVSVRNSRIGLLTNFEPDPLGASDLRNYQVPGGEVFRARLIPDPFSISLDVEARDRVSTIAVHGLVDGAGNTMLPMTLSVDRWLENSMDIGETPAFGEPHSARRGELRVEAQGFGFRGLTDGLHFSYLPMQGDFDYIVRLARFDGAGPLAQAGLMVRDSIDPQARALAVLVTQISPDGPGVVMTGQRSQPGKPVQESPGTTLTHPPQTWLRITRQGSLFRVLHSIDSISWTAVEQWNTAPSPFARTVLLGMAVSSGDATTTAVATFSSFQPAIPPRLTAPIPDRAIGLGTDTVFLAAATGATPLHFRWFRNGVPLEESLRITGVNSPELHLSQALLADSGLYSVQVSNAFGRIQAVPALLTVVQPPTIQVHPTDQFGPFFSTVQFGALVQPPLPGQAVRGPGLAEVPSLPGLATLPGEETRYQWYKDGTAMIDATNAVLVLTNLTRRDVGFYRLGASNIAGVVFTDPAELQVCHTTFGVVTPGVVATRTAGFLAPFDPAGGLGGQAELSAPIVHLSHGVPLFFSSLNGEPQPGVALCGVASVRTKWIGYFSTRHEVLTVTTVGSDFDTVLGVFTNRQGTLNAVGCDRGVPGSLRADVEVQMLRNVFYYIAVDGEAGATGVARIQIGGGALQNPVADAATDAFRVELVTRANTPYTVRWTSVLPAGPNDWTPLALPSYPAQEDWVTLLTLPGLGASPRRFLEALER